MRWTQAFIPTLRDDPADAEAVSHKLLVRAGFIRQLMSGVYTAAFGEDEASQKQLSPITHVAKDKSIPPFLILHVADRPDSTAQSRAFAKALAGAGIQAKVVPGEGKTHATINRELGQPDDEPTKAVFKFLDGLLKDR